MRFDEYTTVFVVYFVYFVANVLVPCDTLSSTDSLFVLCRLPRCASTSVALYAVSQKKISDFVVSSSFAKS